MRSEKNVFKMKLHEKLSIAARLAADLEKRKIRPFEINHGLTDNPYVYDGKPIARKYIYYVSKGLKLDTIGAGTFLRIKTILDNE